MDQAVEFGALEQRMLEDIPLSRHLGARVLAADMRGVVLEAPLAANSNHKGTAFGGSLYCMAVLAGWALLDRELQERGIQAQVVIQSAQTDYLLPVTQDFTARAAAPPSQLLQKCLRTLERYGRSRIELAVSIEQGEIEAVRLRGTYVLQSQ